MKCSKRKSVFKKIFLKRFKSQKGVALIVLMSFVVLMGPVVLYLMDHALQTHKVAQNSVKRLQAYYLSKSAVNMSKLILFYHKFIESRTSGKTTNASSSGPDLLSMPIYKQIPLDTNFLKGLVGSSAPATDESSGEEDSETESSDDSSAFNPSSALGGLNTFQRDKINEFLSFDGGFRSFITEENAKYPINAISKIENTHPSYDLHKKILFSLLMSPELSKAFEDQENDAADLTHALGDYVDINNVINEFDGVERGYENSLYDDDLRPKNAKFLSLSEMRLVPGMNDQIYKFLEPLVTVYHTESGINACLAEETIFRQLLVLFSESSGCTQPLDPEQDAEELDLIVQNALLMCPDKVAMANAVNVAFDLKEEEDVTTATSGSSNNRKAVKSAKVAGCEIQFIDLISDKNQIFSIEAVGEVDQVKTTLKIVLDTSAEKPSQWKTLYYQMQ